MDYNAREDGSEGSRSDFFEHPEKYKSIFSRFSHKADLFIAGHFHNDKAPYLYTREDARHTDFAIEVVADISCDIDGPVASTLQPSTIADPVYGYDPVQETVCCLGIRNPQSRLWLWTICLVSCRGMLRKDSEKLLVQR